VVENKWLTHESMSALVRFAHQEKLTATNHSGSWLFDLSFQLISSFGFEWHSRLRQDKTLSLARSHILSNFDNKNLTTYLQSLNALRLNLPFGAAIGVARGNN
jgi:hypothetical protein